MTVKELIELLAKEKLDATVYVDTNDGGIINVYNVDKLSDGSGDVIING